jgi:hypothetical protein
LQIRGWSAPRPLLGVAALQSASTGLHCIRRAAPLLPLEIATIRSRSADLRRKIPLGSLELRLLSAWSGTTVLAILTRSLTILMGGLTVFSSSLTVLFVPLLGEGGGCSHRRREQEGE